MFKFVFSCQPLYYYIHKVLKRCPTERYIKPVRIPGYLCFKRKFFTNSRNFYEKRSKLSDRAFEKKCPAAIFVLKIFQNICDERERQNFITFFGFVMEQNIAKYKEE